MKVIKFFLLPLILAYGCQKIEKEEEIDLDEMVLVEKEASHLAGDPLQSPQEQIAPEPSYLE